MSCPQPEMLGRFVEDQLDETSRVTIEEHLDDCDECRPVVAMLAKTASQTSKTQLDAMAVTAAAASGTASRPDAMAVTAVADTMATPRDRQGAPERPVSPPSLAGRVPPRA